MLDDNPFDNIYKKVLNEETLNEFISDFTTGFNQGLELAKQGKGFWQGDKKENKQTEIGINQNENTSNSPKIGQIIATPKSNGKYIKAKVLTKIDKKGQWEVELINDDPNSKNYLYYSDIYPEGIIASPEYMKKTHKPKDPNISIKDYYNIEGPFLDLKVGFDTPFSKWYDYKELMKNYGATLNKK
jgi:hypothetical protein